MIRVSTANLYLQSEQGINADQSAMMNTQAQLSSGKQINSPADNPVGAAQAALLQSDLSQLGQFRSNQAQASQLLNNASSTLTQVTNVMQSVNTTLVQAGNGALPDSGRSALAAQLQQDLNQLVGLANTSDGQGGYLFGGSVTSSPPFVQNGNSVSYVGNNDVPSLQISQTRTEPVKYSGAAIFNDVPTGNGTYQSIFSTIASAITALQTPNSSAAVAATNSAAITSALGSTQQAITSLSSTQASMGAQLSELSMYGTVNSDQTLQDQTQMSSIVDLNYATGVSQLAQQQTQYQAALQSYAAISKLSLFNYV
ncbi:putative Flagellar hook-associated protein 3 [Burkholderiales bacterium]|nr:putative Flagellar hook-associated protein 3 [Burkholderiales bacterium]